MAREDSRVGVSAWELGWLMVAAIFSAAVRGEQQVLHAGALLVSPYWAGFYVTNFQDGFRRRALLGTVLRLLEPHGASVVVINVVALAAVGTLLGLFARTFLRLCRRRDGAAVLLTFALFASVLMSVYFQDLGDSMQVALALFVAMMLVSRRVGSTKVRLGVGLAGLALGFFVHEGSIFMSAPLIPYLVYGRPRVRDFVLPAMVLMGLLGLSVHWSALTPHLTYRAISIPAGRPIEIVGTPSFGSLLHTEYVDNLSGGWVRMLFGLKCLGIVAVWCSALVVTARVLDGRAAARVAERMGVMFGFSIPLWVIAHDWGRFLGFMLVLAVVAAGMEFAVQEETAGVERGWRQELADRLTEISSEPAMQCAAMLILLISPFEQSQIFGIDVRDLLSSVGIVGVAFWWVGRQRELFALRRAVR